MVTMVSVRMLSIRVVQTQLYASLEIARCVALAIVLLATYATRFINFAISIPIDRYIQYSYDRDKKSC